MELDIQASTPITLTEMKEKLTEIKKHAKELNFRANKVFEFMNDMQVMGLAEMQGKKKKIAELNVPRLKEKHMVKILDIRPEDPEELKALLVGENITVKQDDLVKIVEVLKE